MPNYLGSTNPFPVRLGGGSPPIADVHNSLLEEVKSVLDTSSDHEAYAETYGDALAVAMIWRINDRLRNQVLPTRMLEALTTWEEATGLRPCLNDLGVDRRANLAGRMRGLLNNALSDIESACMALLGNNFASMNVVDPADEVTYWPGVNPGPPGFEWSSNRARIAIEMTTGGLDAASYTDKAAAVWELLDRCTPDWMTFCVGVGSSFVAAQGIVGQTLI